MQAPKGIRILFLINDSTISYLQLSSIYKISHDLLMLHLNSYVIFEQSFNDQSMPYSRRNWKKLIQLLILVQYNFRIFFILTHFRN
jgi:hypothetical protein